MTEQMLETEGRTRVTADEARKTLDAAVAGYFDDALRHLHAPDGAAPALALKVSPGLGKTHAALAHLARRRRELLTHGHVVYFAPTLELAEQAERDFRRRAPNIPSAVIRGRDAQTAAGERMCVRADIARRISGVVPSVTKALCRSTKDGRTIAAPCATGCPYLAQHDLRRPHVLFTSHAYLTARVPVPGHTALTVIDEKVWPTLARVRRLAVTDWLGPPTPDLSDAHRAAHVRLRSTVIAALEAEQSVTASLRAQGATCDLLRELAQRESAAAPDLSLSPEMAQDLLRRSVQTFDRRSWAVHVARARIFRYLADVIDGDEAERITLSSGRRGTAEIRLHEMKSLGSDTPTLFLDADADAEILQAVRPATVVKAIEVAPRARIVQTTDNTLSTTAVQDRDRGPALRRHIAAVLAREAAAAPNATLLVGTKGTLAAL
jgi:hypothetical protein